MQKKFLSSLGLLVLLNLIVKPLFILGIDAEVQNRVGQEDYGLYFGLLNLSFIFIGYGFYIHAIAQGADETSTPFCITTQQ